MSPTRRKIIYTMIVVAFGILLMTIGVVIGMNLTTPNKTPNNEVEDNGDNDQGIDVGEPNPNTPTDTDEDNNADEMPDALEDINVFESTRYNIQFSYPETFGEHKVTVNTQYFFNEDVSFPNSNIKIGYTRYEGSAGMDGTNVAEGEVNTKQGYTGSYYIFPNSTGYTLFVMVPSPGTNGSKLVISSTASTQSGAEAELLKVQEILNTIEFDFSNVPLDGCETSCK